MVDQYFVQSEPEPPKEFFSRPNVYEWQSKPTLDSVAADEVATAGNTTSYNGYGQDQNLNIGTGYGTMYHCD